MTIYIARKSVYEDALSAYLQKQTYYTMYKNKNKWLQGWNKAGHEVSLTSRLKESKDVLVLMFSGKEFQRWGAELAKERSPQERLTLGVERRVCPADLDLETRSRSLLVSQ